MFRIEKKREQKRLTNVKNAKNVTLRHILARKGSNSFFQTLMVSFSDLVEGLLILRNDVESSLRGVNHFCQ